MSTAVYMLGKPSDHMTKKQIRNSEQTKKNILRAAQKIFSTHSYNEAGLRDIAALAGVNQALINRYFGSKEKLFKAALTEGTDLSYLTSSNKSEFGKRAVETFLQQSDDNTNPLQILVFAMADAKMRDVAVAFLEEQVLIPISNWIGTSDSEERAAHFVSITVGFFTHRLLLPIDTFTGDLSPQTREWLEKTLQSTIE